MQARDLPWLSSNLEYLDQLFSNDRMPHGLIVHGPKGVGKQLLVNEIVHRWLQDTGTATHANDGDNQPHPDHINIQPEDGKKQISVDAIRGLIKRMVLTSSKGRQVAVIRPAEAMNRNAANSLLKTLEEPTDGSLLILVTDAVSRLLPTITSRCQRIHIHAPTREVAAQWLSAQGVEANTLLDLTGNAPLEAKRLADAGLTEQLVTFEQQIEALRSQTTDVPTVASEWLEHDATIVLDWLYYATAKRIKAAPAESLVLHNYLTGIAAARILANTALNTQLLYEALLTPWYDQFGRSMDYLPSLYT